MTIELLYSEYLKKRVVTTDSRHVEPGSIFFALKGDNFDGNTFAASALDTGAAWCVIDNPEFKCSERCIVVDDVLATLQELARFHRSRLTMPVVGITGTNGKTTTKELVAAVLSRRYKVWATKGNLNNHIGVPLTLLSMPADTEIAVVEMGANHPGEIDFLCNIANPDCGLITNVGKAHLGGFGSLQGVLHTKTELYRHLAAMAGLIFVNADNAMLMEHAEKLAQLPSNPSILPGVVPSFPGAVPGNYTDNFSPRGVNLPMASIVTYGSSEVAECKGSLISSDPYMKFYFENGDTVYTVQSQLLGGYNFDNAMAAVCVGRYFGVEEFDIKSAIEQYTPTNNRSQMKHTSRNDLILDCYNANPSSMRAALDNLRGIHSDSKAAILGDMRELGSDSVREHQIVVSNLMEMGLKHVLLVGQGFSMAKNQKGILWFDTVDAARNYLTDNPIEDCTILLKGSNSNRMWLLEDCL